MQILEDKLEEFKNAQIKRFIEKSLSHPINDICNDDVKWDREHGLSITWLSKEVIYHYEKWKNVSLTESKKTEALALIDLANSCFLLRDSLLR